MGPRLRREVSREEMIDTIKNGVEIQPLTRKEVEEYFTRRYSDAPWVRSLLESIKLKEKKVKLRDSGEYNIKDHELCIPIYKVEWTTPEIYKRVIEKKPDLKEEYENALGYGNDVALQNMSDELIRAIYDEINGFKTELKTEKRGSVLDALDHEIGHSLLSSIQQGIIDVGVSEEEIREHFIQKMRKNKEITIKLARTYLPRQFIRLEDEEVWKKIAGEVFGKGEDPREVSPLGKKIVLDMITYGKSYPGYHNTIVVSGNAKEIDLERVIGSLPKEIREKLDLSKIKPIDDLNGKEGIWVEREEYEFGRTRREHLAVYINLEKKELIDKYNLTEEQYNKLREIANRTVKIEKLVHEAFARTLDALVDGEIEPDPEKPNFPLTGEDLEFFSQFRFQGEQMFGEEIEEIRKKMKKVIPKRK